MSSHDEMYCKCAACQEVRRRSFRPQPVGVQEQPDPQPNQSRHIADLVVEDILARKDEEFGIEDYRDRVCVIVESGDPGGEPGEFEAFMGESLSEWCGFDPDITAQQVETIVGFNPASQARYCYEVVAPGEPGAGIRGFTDSVTVLLESGNPGGDPGDFKGHLRAALNQWYDGAKVTQVDSK